MNRIPLLLLLLFLGCVQPPRGASPDAHDVKPAANSEQAIWRALGDRVELGRVADTDELIRIVRELKADDDLEDISKMETVLPGITQENQPINDGNRVEIATKLRSLR